MQYFVTFALLSSVYSVTKFTNSAFCDQFLLCSVVGVCKASFYIPTFSNESWLRKFTITQTENCRLHTWYYKLWIVSPYCVMFTSSYAACFILNTVSKLCWGVGPNGTNTIPTLLALQSRRHCTLQHCTLHAHHITQYRLTPAHVSSCLHKEIQTKKNPTIKMSLNNLC